MVKSSTVNAPQQSFYTEIQNKTYFVYFASIVLIKFITIYSISIETKIGYIKITEKKHLQKKESFI